MTQESEKLPKSAAASFTSSSKEQSPLSPLYLVTQKISLSLAENRMNAWQSKRKKCYRCNATLSYGCAYTCRGERETNLVNMHFLSLLILIDDGEAHDHLRVLVHLQRVFASARVAQAANRRAKDNYFICTNLHTAGQLDVYRSTVIILYLNRAHLTVFVVTSWSLSLSKS